MTAPARRTPRVAVVYDLGSATPNDILAAAHRLCDVLFVADFDRPGAAAHRPAMLALAEVLDVTGQDPPERLRLLREAAVDGIVTYSEYQLAETARLAHGLGLPHHDPDLVPALVDKLVQRGILAAAGVQATRCAVIGGDPAQALDLVGLPAVIKPRIGAGSLHTTRVDTAEEFLATAAARPAGTEFVAEQMLEGDPAVAGEFWGDYVSVESVHTGSASRQVCVTGKFALAEPFRETGMLLPATLTEEDAAAALALEAAAVRALGIRHGITHTEIKLTADGPRIIEVNGRLGGYVPEILRRATGINLVRTALEVALGGQPRIPAPRHRGVTYQYFLTPPAVAGTLTSVDGVAELAELPGVRHVETHAEPGRSVDWREGTQSHLGVVYGTAPDHDALRKVAEAIDAAFRPVLAPSAGADA
ncbi:ATP-grasp domain-containing protein [Kitasatospora sp. NPDC057198]|uniref:ATP-grasp domain-containing protein n=1 Tax=Kitasatospora sp. NPDC057198 TaxID=3346046 RepID=UPI00363E3B19